MNAHFRFATDILRRLGEELNPGNDQSLLELVKNSYDADAKSCTITLSGADSAGGSVEIADDGDGMTLQGLRDGWLVLGHSSKATNQQTRLGRVPAGSKGLGRLAALRMGEAAIVTTRSRHNLKSEFRLAIDWQKFDKAALVDNVVLPIRRHRSSAQMSGTTIRIEKLRKGLTKAEVKSLARSLVLLADPFGSDKSGFQPKLIAPDFAEYEHLVKERYFSEADYHLIARLDGKGNGAARVVDDKGAPLFSAKHKDLSTTRDGNIYACPPCRFDAWIFILDAQNFIGRRSAIRDVRGWLANFGGVHVYQNGIRVSPYGNQGNDWLAVNLRRAQSPEERPSTNTMIGRIEVKDPHGQLVQKTDRSGFIENEAFSELTAFAHDAMEWLARRRLEVAQKRREQERNLPMTATDKAKRNINELIDSAPDSTKQDLKDAFENYEKQRLRETTNLRREVQLYRTLSTTGITAATFSHESSGNPLKVITQAVGAIERRGRTELGNKYATTLEKPVVSIQRAISTLGVLSSTTLSLIDHDKRRLRRVDIYTVIERLLDTFKPFFKGRDVTVETDLAQGRPYLRGSEAAVESVVTNLLNNSLAAFESTSAPRLLRLSSKLLASAVLISVNDSGPGIQGVNLRDIWLPGVSTKTNGTGLGLAIVRDTVVDLGGKVSAAEHGSLGGAEITVELPILGS